MEFFTRTLTGIMPSKANNNDHVETFYCYICCETNDVKKGVVLPDCKHYFCQACFRDYCVDAVASKHVKLSCFHPVENDEKHDNDEACNVLIQPEFVRGLLGTIQDAQKRDEILNKFTRFSNEDMFCECPKCKHNVTRRSAADNSVVCEQCKFNFCFVHADAHLKQSCAAFEKDQLKRNKKTEELVKDKCKNCPKCAAPILKNGGCNHMFCTNCKTDWCWRCKETFETKEDVNTHYSTAAENTNDCKGKQFEGPDRGLGDALNALHQLLRHANIVLRFSFYALLVLLVAILIASSLVNTIIANSITLVLVWPVYGILVCMGADNAPTWATENTVVKSRTETAEQTIPETRQIGLRRCWTHCVKTASKPFANLMGCVVCPLSVILSCCFTCALSSARSAHRNNTAQNDAVDESHSLTSNCEAQVCEQKQGVVDDHVNIAVAAVDDETTYSV